MGDFDPATGSHYRLPPAEPPASHVRSSSRHNVARALRLSSGLPRANSSAMMAAPFTGQGRLTAISLSFRYSVGYPSPAHSPNVTCAAGIQFAGGAIHVANLSSVAAAVSWCRDAMPKCAGFTVQTSSCTGASSSSSNGGQQQYEFKDSWGVQHKSQTPGTAPYTHSYVRLPSLLSAPKPDSTESVGRLCALHRRLELVEGPGDGGG